MSMQTNLIKFITHLNQSFRIVIYQFTWASNDVCELTLTPHLNDISMNEF